MSDQTQPSLKDNIKQRSTWMRGLYMLLFMLFYGIAEFLLFAVVLFQFVSTLITKKTNERLLSFGRDLSAYMYNILLFLTFNSDDKPYPFDNFPAHAGALTAADETS